MIYEQLGNIIFFVASSTIISIVVWLFRPKQASKRALKQALRDGVEKRLFEGGDSGFITRPGTLRDVNKQSHPNR